MTRYRVAESMFQDHEAFGRRHRLIMKVMVVWFFLVFAAAITMMVLFFTGNLNASYSYNYQVGDLQYSESYEMDR